ncbi:uncharacterized protein LOC135825350 [Sycon ciliatum]|uniref:uncharacterized protein LOC135825350 n=1 Tax=Sycon ciliatum TaxID=27933 RepID=UPI0031F5F85F
MDAHQKPDVRDDDATEVAKPQHDITTENTYAMPELMAAASQTLTGDDKLQQEELHLESANSDATRSQHVSEYLQVMEQGPIPNELDSVSFDVLQGTLLPMLSILDIFQLCGVSRNVKKLLLNEYTFKHLCQKRYHLSPYLEMSYIRAARILYIAGSVASLHHSLWDSIKDFVVERANRWVFDRKYILLKQLRSLALMAPPTTGEFTSWTFSCLQSDLIHVDLFLVAEACDILPNLSPGLFQDKRTDSSDGDADMNVYRIEDVTTWLQDICGSTEECQEAMIEHFQQDIPKLVLCLPYVNRSRRLVDVAQCFYSIAIHDTRLLAALSTVCPYFCEYGLERIIPRWTYNPFVHWDFVSKNKCAEHEAAISTNHWIHAVGQFATKHSVVKLLIMGSMRTVPIEDYFMAVMEYEDFLKGLPKSSIPDRATLYLHLGSYLQPALQGTHSRKEWTADELFKAMVDYGKVLATKSLETA